MMHSREKGRSTTGSRRLGSLPLIEIIGRSPRFVKSRWEFTIRRERALSGQSHDYKRHGTTTLFAALEIGSGRIVAAHSRRRRRVGFLGFMNRVVVAFPDRELHVVLDNLNTHKKYDRWLKKHPNVHFHFTPTRSSWLNRLETWFSILQGQSLNGASFTSVEQSQEHIDAFISAYNETAAPFAWTKKRVYQRIQKSPYVIPGKGCGIPVIACLGQTSAAALWHGE